jgi:hypothetical protein
MGRIVLWLLLSGVAAAQGIASGNATGAPRAKPSGLPFAVQFADVAREAGLTARFVQGDPARKKYILEATGSGVAFIDYDNDGLTDVFLVNGSRFGKEDGSTATNHLYHNVGGGKFEDVSRVTGMDQGGWGNGVCAGDYDNDGYLDLYVTYWGPNRLFRNKEGRGFEEVAGKAKVAGPAGEWTTGCTFLDYDRDGHLDLLTASYAGFDPATTPTPGSSAFCMYRNQPVYCGPRGLPSGRVTLYRNTGKGVFEDVSAKAGLAGLTGFYAFTTLAADWNRDGWVDVYVACDSTPSLLLRNNKNGTFSEIGTESGVAFNDNGAEQAGMGVSVADFDRDGWLDLTKTNFLRDYPNLYRNQGNAIFEDIVFKSGLAVNPQYVLWGTGFEDFDNDGWKDVFQVGGHVYPELNSAEPFKNPRLLYRNLGQGRFEEVRGVPGSHASRGAAFGDFDNDGDIDVLIMNMDEPPTLLRNMNTSGNHWVQLRLQGTKSNRAAIGSTVTLGGQAAAVLSQSSYLSVNDLRLHFGLGKNSAVPALTVQWPSGVTERFTGVAADRINLLVEGTGTAKAVP